MTVSASTGRAFNIGQHIALAYKTAGLLEASQEPSLADYELGRQNLENILDALETHGVFARAVTFHELTLIVDQYIYDMPDWVMEVIRDGAYIDPDEVVSAANGETPVQQMRREEWQGIATKSASGRPTRYFNDRNEDVQQVYLWPRPDEAGTIRFQVIRHLSDADSNTATLDLDRYWSKYIQYALCAALCEAKSQPVGRIGYFERKAKQELRGCVNKANEFPGNQIYLDHGPMNYRRAR